MHVIDQAIIAAWLVATVGIGLWFSRRAGSSSNAWFVADRSLPWWVVGTSMVATTFAADTPLVVAGYVASGGIVANWKWWWVGIAGMGAVFFFARLWRRADIVTDAELTELRYHGAAAGWLRGFKGIWFGVVLNVLVIAWVMGAMRKLVGIVLDLEPDAMMFGMPTELAVTLVLFALAAGYTVGAGLFGVVATDVVQFVVAMFGSVAMACLAWIQIGGLSGLQAGFSKHDFDWEATTSLLPLDDLSPDGTTASLVAILCIIWWTNKVIDGGGYLAQRLFAAKDDKHALWAYLWFTVANLCLRPWPWIAVGLAGMATFGPVDDPELYYPMMMVHVLPVGLLGLMIASFLAAFMSTIDTQLHWGTTLLVNDVYRRFIAKGASDVHILKASRTTVIALALFGAIASTYLESLSGAWELAFSVTAGLGSVHIARWYWWRTNAWSEITAMVVAALATGVISVARGHHPLNTDTDAWSWLASVPVGWMSFPFNAALIALLVMPCWVTVTMLTQPTPSAHLRTFYDRVRPGGFGWISVHPEALSHGPTRSTFVGMVAAIIGVFGVLLGVGEILLGRGSVGALWLAAAIVGIVVASRSLKRETAS